MLSNAFTRAGRFEDPVVDVAVVATVVVVVDGTTGCCCPAGSLALTGMLIPESDLTEKLLMIDFPDDKLKQTNLRINFLIRS